ncbi:TRAP transporter small permease subunit [Roseomonas populi]|uniref:TRAP transporter small permease protein n=1 Tax=Roseomonas populi TaxID=3121582 RepID=A0ABT1WY62_9PROT|nr:TRAP transporter small permease [Roseomonas pecuniae]MCR0980785.1 TRAP transporter small permease [Roseomonas pecuniae]
MSGAVPAPLAAARGLTRGVSYVATVMAYLAGWNYIACAALITFDVVGRSFFGVSSAATVEISSYMLACGIAWALAHTLARRAHIRVDVLVNRMPLRARALLHVLSLAMLAAFAGFVAWAGWQILDESMLFEAHDNSALRIPLDIPQGIWAFGLLAFLAMTLVLLLESVLALLFGLPEEVDSLLGSRSVDDETQEALEAVAMAREEHPA